MAENNTACVALSHSRSKQVADPTTALMEALTKFNGILTDDQKRLYHVSATKPDVESVIAFVTEIDANKNNTMKMCVGSRLHKFLEATQQFSDVVGTFVSSHPEIAALVWGGVKTAILTASNIASYFGKVTSMIMEVGRSCPTYQQFGHLYPDHIGLQRELCEYYAAIVQLCTKVIEVSRRPLLTQTISSIFNPFESDFKTVIDQLNQAAKDVQLQISLASNQVNVEAKKLLEYESRDQATFRKLTKTFQRDAQAEHAEAHQWRVHMMNREAASLRSSIRDSLSKINYLKPWKQAIRQRVPSTAEWLLHEPLFQKWQSDHDAAILWCPGTMGVGKTVLMSNVVAQLHALRKSNEIISYYFCRADDVPSLSARNILGSLARQILDSDIGNASNENLQRLREDSRDLNTIELVDFILNHLHDDDVYYLAIDGLDECEITEVRKLAQCMAQLCSARVENFKVIYTGRPELESELFRSVKGIYKVPVTEKKVDSEINCYIDTTLRLCLEEEQLKIRDPTLVLKIADALRNGSKGMFLWTRLFIEELCAQGSDSEILESLKHPPRGLSEIFDRKISRVRNKATAKDSFKILQFCGVVKRPLTAMEYQEALSLSPGQKSLKLEKLPNDMNKVIGDCCGLLFIDEEDSTVHFIHHSVKEHLFDIACRYTEEFDVARLDWHIGVLCMTYLDFSDFKRQLAKFQKGSNTSIRPVQLEISAFNSSSNISGRMAQRLLSYSQKLRHLRSGDIERKAWEQVLGDEEFSRLEKELQTRGFHFLEYARTHWINHLANPPSTIEDATWSLFRRCVEGKDGVAYRPWESAQNTYDDRDDAPPMIKWLLTHCHFPLLLYYAKHTHILTEDHKRHILEKSIQDGQDRLARCIIQHGHDSPDLMNEALFFVSREGWEDLLPSVLQVVTHVNFRVDDHTSLQAAVGGGHIEVVEQLLAAKADVNAPPGKNYGRTALQAAAEGGYLEIVDRLLAAKADVDAAPGKHYGRTALQAAVEGGYLEIVDRLLAAKANVNMPAGYHDRRTALQAAAKGGYLEIVDRLLAAKANVNMPAEDYIGRTALQAAAEGGYLEIVDRLLAAKADVNAPAGRYNGRTALQAAAGRGHLEIVDRLLAAKAGVNTTTGYENGRTALQAAAEGGYLEIVDRLLAAEAEVNMPAGEANGRTALQAAAEGGYLEIVDRLLAAKADVNAPAGRRSGRTALQAAAGEGHLEIVDRLLAAKADVNAPAADLDGKTALQAAAENVNNAKVVECLMQAGACQKENLDLL